MSVEAARAAMLAACSPLGAEQVALAGALGRFLAEDVIADRDQPPFAASAMDGWAVRAADGAEPRRIVGEIAAGRGFAGVVGPGEAVRIFTGAPMPEGADTVVIQEDAQRDGDTLAVPAITDPRHVRPAGLDFRAGAILLSSGVRLDPWRLALAAAAGRAGLRVARRPVIGVLSTGEEVVEPGETPGRFQIFNSGTTALAGAVTLWGGVAAIRRPVGDDKSAIAEAAADLACDVLVTIGGASVGDHDLVKPALEGLGLKLTVESVAVRPGKPTSFGLLADGRRVLGLPGNPASALVCADLFLKPIIRALQAAEAEPRLVAARTSRPLPANGGRELWMRAKLELGSDGTLTATPLPDQDSSLVTVFAEADALLRRAPGVPALEAGDLAEVLILDRAL